MLLSLFPLFPSPPAAQKRPPRYLLSRATISLFFFRHCFPPSLPPPPPPPPLLLYRAARIPLVRLQLRRPFSPSNSSLFLLRCSAPAYPPARPAPRRPTSAAAEGFFLSVLLLRVLSPLLSFFLSAPRSRCPWSVISRRGGDENARLGLRARLLFFANSLSLVPARYPRSFRSPLFFPPRSFSYFSRRARVAAAAVVCRDREKQHRLQTSALSHCRDI